MSSWSAALRLKTRKILDGNDPFPTEGILPMKNINSFSAYLKHADLRNGQIILYDAETHLATCFQSAGEMFDAGWIADLQTHFQLHLMTVNKNTTESNAPTVADQKPPFHTLTPEASSVVPLKTCKAKE